MRPDVEPPWRIYCALSTELWLVLALSVESFSCSPRACPATCRDSPALFVEIFPEDQPRTLWSKIVAGYRALQDAIIGYCELSARDVRCCTPEQGVDLPTGEALSNAHVFCHFCCHFLPPFKPFESESPSEIPESSQRLACGGPDEENPEPVLWSVRGGR